MLNAERIKDYSKRKDIINNSTETDIVKYLEALIIPVDPQDPRPVVYNVLAQKEVSIEEISLIILSSLLLFSYTFSINPMYIECLVIRFVHTTIKLSFCFLLLESFFNFTHFVLIPFTL